MRTPPCGARQRGSPSSRVEDATPTVQACWLCHRHGNRPQAGLRSRAGEAVRRCRSTCARVHEGAHGGRAHAPSTISMPHTRALCSRAHPALRSRFRVRGRGGSRLLVCCCKPTRAIDPCLAPLAAAPSAGMRPHDDACNEQYLHQHQQYLRWYTTCWECDACGCNVHL